METRNNTTGNTETINARVRSGLIVLGIVTSIICSLILLKDIRSAEHTETSLVTPSAQIVQVVKAQVSPIRIVSALWTPR